MSAEVQTVIDEAQLGGLAEAAGVDGVRMILDAFWQSTEELSVELLAALEHHDRADIARIGHTLKGAAANIGAAQMSDRARLIEIAGKDGTLEAARDELNAFRTDIANTREAIEDILRRYA